MPRSGARTEIRAFLPELGELVGEGMVTLEDVEVVHYAGRPRP